MINPFKKYNGKFFFTSALLVAGMIVAVVIYFDIQSEKRRTDTRTREAVKLLLYNQLENIRAVRHIGDTTYVPDTLSIKKFLEGVKQ